MAAIEPPGSPSRVDSPTRPRDPLRPVGATLASPGPLTAFRSPDYRTLYVGTLMTQGANWMQQVAQQWLLYTLTNSPLYLGLVGFARASPMLFISPFGGVLADRLNRRYVMIASQLFATIVAIWQWWLVWQNIAQPWQVLLAAFLTGAAMAVNGPARQAIVPSLVERPVLTSAIALNSAGQNATRVVGPTLAGWLIQAVGLSICFLLQAGGLAWALFTSLRLHVPPTPDSARAGSPLDNLREAFGYIRESPVIGGVLWLAAIPSVFAYSYLSLLPIFARDILAGGSSTLGTLMASNGFGAVIGSVLIAFHGQRPRRGRWIFGLAILYNVLLSAFALSNWLPLSMLALAGCGLAGSAFNSLSNTLLVELAPDELRGRLTSAYMLTWGLMPLGALPAGALAEVLGAQWTVVAFNVICAALLIVLALRNPHLREVD